MKIGHNLEEESFELCKGCVSCYEWGYVAGQCYDICPYRK